MNVRANKSRQVLGGCSPHSYYHLIRCTQKVSFSTDFSQLTYETTNLHCTEITPDPISTYSSLWQRTQSSVEVTGYLQLCIYTGVQSKAFPLYLESFRKYATVDGERVTSGNFPFSEMAGLCLFSTSG